MTTEQQTTAPATEPQGTHQYFLTLQVPTGGGFVIQTWSGTWTPPAGTTRHDFYRLLRDDIARNSPEFAHASVLFFDIQRNTL
ncbi:hypothetical protein ACGRHY_14380 [Streptomyces sp. HK10]|uniref:hypothetical protein n=1 Tax=Streptomyces sp. HK10 TaxID=3373255 RepID=UPI00374A9358